MAGSVLAEHIEDLNSLMRADLDELLPPMQGKGQRHDLQIKYQQNMNLSCATITAMCRMW